MIKFLWDLDLDKIPLGWEELYQDALKNNPNGCTIELPSSNYDGTITFDKYFDHPVKSKELIYSLFNKYKSEAKKLYENRHEYDFKQIINRLFELDALLFYLLSNWVASDEYQRESLLVPDDYINLDTSSILSWYLNEASYDSDFIKHYGKYRLMDFL